MGKRIGVVQLALREKRGLMIPLAIWGMATLICVIAGPFGTLAALGPAARFTYWAIVVGASVGASTALSRKKTTSASQRVFLWVLFAVLLSLLIWGLNALVFEGWQNVAQLGQILGYVGAVVVVVHGIFMLFDHAGRETTKDPGRELDPQTLFLRRLPLAERGPLVRIEAQDHYLKVVTDRGAALILMRLSDAVQELGETAGLQVHRSHWVALEAVTAHRREKGRDLLILSGGAEVPVSRGNRGAAQEAGLF